MLIKPITMTSKSPLIKKILSLDPTPFYNNITIDPYKRFQPYNAHKFSRDLMFPKNQTNSDNQLVCSCGCGIVLTGRKRRWASKLCSDWTYDVFSIIQGNVNRIIHFLSRKVDYKCNYCGVSGNEVKLDLDHIKSVKHGGSGLWLDNYQFLCKPCHRKKTNNDFGWKSK